jgi:O-antigen biosynthesis alpha-1,3-rhamnosyltransferase
MLLALNASILRAPRTGIGQYLVELVQALTVDPQLELALFNGWNWQSELPGAALPGYSRASGLIKRWVPNAYALRRLIEQQRFNRGNAGVDLYHDPSLWPFEFDGPMVMTLHDLTHVHFPETQPKDRLVEIERHVARSVERAQRILVDSDFIGAEVCRYYGVAAERVTVAPLGCAARFHPRSAEQLAAPLQALGLCPGEYLLCVGTVEPRKNLQLALRAYEQLPAAVRSRYPLVIVGMPGWRTEQLAAPLQRAIASGQVRLLLPNCWLARACWCFRLCMRALVCPCWKRWPVVRRCCSRIVRRCRRWLARRALMLICRMSGCVPLPCSG